MLISLCIAHLGTHPATWLTAAGSAPRSHRGSVTVRSDRYVAS